MTAAVFGTGLRYALASGAPPAAVTGYAPASAKNNFMPAKECVFRNFATKTLD